jgi:hypothetical protein
MSDKMVSISCWGMFDARIDWLHALIGPHWTREAVIELADKPVNTGLANHRPTSFFVSRQDPKTHPFY